jgi:hypothetical protein
VEEIPAGRGSTVEWEIGLQGAIVGNAMLADKNDIGYMGDMPTIVAISKQNVRELRMVAVLGLANDQCSVFLSRNEAPDFKTPEEAVKWWHGKRVAVAKGSCTDRSGQETMRKFGITPEQYLNQNIEVQTSNFKAGTPRRLDHLGADRFQDHPGRHRQARRRHQDDRQARRRLHGHAARADQAAPRRGERLARGGARRQSLLVEARELHQGR